MSWFWPSSRIYTNQVMDPDRYNETWFYIASILGGGLNEHNHKLKAFPNRTTDMDTTFIKKDRVVFEPTTDPIYGSTNRADGSDFFWGPSDGAWHRVQLLTLTFVSVRGGSTYISAMVQHRGGGGTGLQYALHVDGVLIGESIVGSGDLSNDMIGSEGPEPDATPGISHSLIPVSTHAVIELTPGEHTIDMVCKSLMIYNSNVNSNGCLFYVHSDGS